MQDPFNASTWLVDRHVDAGGGDRIALVDHNRSWTYAQVADEVVCVGAALRANGVAAEQRVALVLLDSIEFVTAFLGVMRIGAIPVPLNPLLPGRDLGVIAAEARARTVIASTAVADGLADLTAGAPEVGTVVTTEADGVSDLSRHVRTMDWPTFLASGEGEDGTPYPTWAESPGFWLCTSGSTGRPRLATHRHGDIPITCNTYAASVLEIGPDDRCFSVGPLFHAYGLGNSLTFPFAVGASAVLEAHRPPTPERVAEILARHRPTLFFCIPTFYAALNSADVPDDAFESVRVAISAAEPLPAETYHRFKERFGVHILDGIGSTELLHIYLSNTLDDLRPGTSGRPVAGYEVRIADQQGSEQPPGVPGQLWVKGDSMATGYWCRADMSRSRFQGPWMHTGDLYVRDDAGYYTYLGRIDDMLRVGGEWVSPAEVEGALIEHAGVHEAAVVGERDGAGVLRPVAYVIPAEGTAESDLAAALHEFCRERLAGFKRPRRYEIVASLPKTATGKIQRFKLRD